MNRIKALCAGIVLWIASCLGGTGAGCKPLPPVEPAPDDNTTVVVVPEPDPQEPPAPDPQDPAAATPCERACAKYARLGCAPPIPECVRYCEAAEEQGPAYSTRPECADEAVTCEAWNACATGAR